MNQVALVTGATSGIGADTARELKARGFVVYAAGRRADRLAALAAEGLLPLELDVTDDAACVAAVDRIIAEQGRIDVLVNNAGYGALGSMEEVPAEEGRRQFDVNVFGPFRLIQLVLPHMRAQRSGRIVNVSSIGGRVHSLLGGWYHGTKFAMEGMSDALRLEVAPFGIEVSVVEPGATATEWGTIAADGLERTSGDGPYAADARAVATNLRKVTGAGGVPASEVSAAIVDAVTSPNPKTRYLIGRSPRLTLVARRLLPDKAFDRVVRRSVGR